MGFDLALHARYEVEVPLEELAGSGNTLTAIFRVTLRNSRGEPVYFRQNWVVPSLDARTKGSAYLRGEFMLGTGEYQIDWLMRDRADRFCSEYWHISAKLRGKDSQITMRLPPGTVQPVPADVFAAEEPVQREQRDPLKVRILLNVAPHSAGAGEMRPDETAALLSILRSAAREPRIGKFSVSAFNIEQAEVVYQEDDRPHIDFPGLGRALKQVRWDTIPFQKLLQRNREVEFLVGLLNHEAGPDQPDALIFVGSKSAAATGAWSGSLKSLGERSYPVFYLNYDADRRTSAWRDLIGAIVKFWRGSEYTIEQPRDVYFAWAAVMAQITKVKDRQLRPAPSSEKVRSGTVSAKSLQHQQGS
jgi:hypothetical protein